MLLRVRLSKGDHERVNNHAVGYWCDINRMIPPPVVLEKNKHAPLPRASYIFHVLIAVLTCRSADDIFFHATEVMNPPVSC